MATNDHMPKKTTVRTVGELRRAIHDYPDDVAFVLALVVDPRYDGAEVDDRPAQCSITYRSP